MLVLDNIAKLFFLLVALFALHASAAPRVDGVAPVRRSYVTNAERLRAGLGPLKPRNLYNPSRISARAPTTSVVPISGKIKIVRKSNQNSVVGYIAKSVGSPGFGVVSSASNALSVTFTPNAPFNIAISGNTYPYLGFAGGNLGTTSVHSLVATNPTAPGASPQNVGNTLSGQSESSIWFYSSGSLTAQWINSGGSKPETHFWYYPSSGRLAIIRTPVLQLSGYEVLFTVV